MHIGMLLDLRDPVTNRLKRAAVRYVVNEENALGTAEVGSGDRPEALLSSGIPNLKLDFRPVNVDILDLEVNSDCRNERWTEGVVRITEQQTRLANPGVANHEKLDLDVVWGATSLAHGWMCTKMESNKEMIRFGRNNT